MLILGVIITLIHYTTAIETQEVTLDHGIVIIREEHKVAYEGSVPIHIRVAIPSIDPHVDRLDHEHECYQATGRVVCKYLDLLRPMYNNAFEIISNNFANLFPAGSPITFKEKPEKSPAIRLKRNVLGKFLNWCCSVITEDEYLDVKSDEKVLEKYVTKLQEGVHERHKGILNLQDEVSSLSNQTDKALKTMHVTMGKTMKDMKYWVQHYDHTWTDTVMYSMTTQFASLISLQNSALIMNNYRYLRIQCENRKIPTIFVTDEAIKSGLENMEKELHKHDKQLAIPSSNIKLYKELPIAECLFEKDQFLVKIKAPFVTKGKLWELYTVKPVAFAFGSHTRIVDVPAVPIAKTGIEIMVIDPADQALSNNCARGLCKLPEDRSAYSQYLPCLELLFKQSSIEQLKKACLFKIINSTATRVTKKTNNVFSVAHLGNDAAVVCLVEGKKIVQSTPKGPEFSNIEVTLPCHCSLQKQGTILAAPSFPCSKDDLDDTKFLQVAPAQWTKLKDIILTAPDLDPTRPTVSNFSEVQDDWSSGVVPIHAVTNDERAKLLDDDQPEEENVKSPVTSWFESQVRREFLGLWIFIFLLAGIIGGCVAEIIRLREDVNPVLAALALQGLPQASAQTFSPTAVYFPAHLEVLIIITFAGVMFIVLPLAYKIFVSLCTKLRPQPNRNFHRPTYRQMLNRGTIDSNASTDTQLSTISEEPVFGPTTVLIDNQSPTKAGFSGFKKKGMV